MADIKQTIQWSSKKAEDNKAAAYLLTGLGILGLGIFGAIYLNSDNNSIGLGDINNPFNSIQSENIINVPLIPTGPLSSYAQ